MKLPSTIALVSGGASGLGAAVAPAPRRRPPRSWSPTSTATRRPRSRTSSARFGRPPPTARPEADVLAALDLAEKSFGAPVSAAVSTAGTLHAAKAVSRKGAPHLLDPFERVLRVNVLGSFNVARLAARGWRRARPTPRRASAACSCRRRASRPSTARRASARTAASKGAIVGMTLPLARDLAPLGVRVATVAPGVFETPMMAAASDEVRDGLAKSIPFPPRFGSPDEFASLVEHVISNPYLNGEVIRLDGGVRMT